MEYMDKLRDKLCDELDEIARKPEMSAGDLETAHKLTDTIKNIDKIAMPEEDGGYSQAGDWEMEGRGSYARGSSYRNQRRDSRGRYSRDRGRMYSRADGKEHMMMELEEAMNAATSERDREAIRRVMSQVGQE